MAASERTSKIIPGFDEDAITGLHFRRSSSSLKIPREIKPVFLEESIDDTSDDRELPYAPDGGYGWVIVLASFLCNFVLDGISLSQGVLIDDIRKASGVVNESKSVIINQSRINSEVVEDIYDEPEYEITVAQYNIISAVLLCVTLSVGPFISLLTDRYGFRIVSFTGSILASCGILLSVVVSPSVPNVWAFIVFFGGLSGVGFGMMFQPSIVIVGMYFENWRPLATGIAIAGTGVGTFAFPPVVTQISKIWGWQWAFIFQAAITLLSALFAFLYVPLPTRPVKMNPRDSKTHERCINLRKEEPEKVGFRSMWIAMGPLSASPTFLVISISGAITMLGFFAPYSFLADMGLNELGLHKDTATFLVSTIGIANTAGRLIFGLICCHPWINCLILSNGALTVAGIATILVPFATAHYQLVLYAVVFGFGIAIFTVLRSILVLKFMGMEKFNNAFGLSLLFMGVGTLIGNPLGGHLKDSTGSYDISFFAAGGYLLLSGVMCYPLQWINEWEKGKARHLEVECERQPSQNQEQRKGSLVL